MQILDTMVDIETLATDPDATILSIAAVKFDPFDDYKERGVTVGDLPTLNLLVDFESQAGRQINENTLTWWSKQDPAICESMFADNLPRVSLEDALNQLHKFLWNSTNRIWCQGTHFDITILEHAYRSIGRGYPWQYYQPRDSRTLLDLVAVDLPPANHDAVQDCYRQIIGVQQALNRLGVTKFIR